MNKHNSILLITWMLDSLKDDEFIEHNELCFDLENKDYDYLTSDEEPTKPVIITFEGLDSFMEYYIDKIAKDFIIDNINKELNPSSIINPNKKIKDKDVVLI